MKIYIAVPTISSKAEGQVHPRLAHMLNQAARERDVIVDYVDEYRPIPAARNEILNRFLNQSRCEWLIMCDLDTVPRNPQWFRLMTQTEKRPIVAGAYALNSNDGRFQYSVGWRICPECHQRVDSFADRFRCPRHPYRDPAEFTYFFSNRLERNWSDYDIAGFGNIAIQKKVLFELIPGFRDERPQTMKTEDVCFFEDTRAKVWTHPDLVCEHWRLTDVTRALEVQSQLMDRLEER